MYLTPELKSYYAEDFQQVCAYFLDPYWQLDKGLKPILERINQHPEMHSLYSRYHQSRSGIEEPISYLRLAYSEGLKKPLQSFGIKLIRELDGPNAEVIIREEGPQPNQVFESEDAPMGCLNNPDYFQIHHYYIGLLTAESEKHHAFWKIMEAGLPSLK